MQGLRYVANVVDQEAKDKGALISLVGEVRSDLVRVGRLGSTALAFHELSEGFESPNGVNIRLGEGEIVERSAILVQVGQVDEVPVGLEAVALTLDVVSESGALRERVILLLNKAWVVLSEYGKLVKSCLKNVWVASLKKALSLSSDEDVCGAVECLDLRSEGSEGEDGRGVGDHGLTKKRARDLYNYNHNRTAG